MIKDVISKITTLYNKFIESEIMKIITLVAIFAIVAAIGIMGIASMSLIQEVHADKCVGDGCSVTKINGHNKANCHTKSGDIIKCKA